eukprot:202827_1
MTEVHFYFDVVCPFAYLASTQINQLCQKYNVTPIWKPVLLGGLYEFSKAPQGKKNSATTVMIPAKRLYNSRDNVWQQNRLGVVQRYPTGWPNKTLYCQRLLTAMRNDEDRMKCAIRLYNDLWVKNKDVANREYLKQVASDYNIDINVIDDPLIKKALTDNTRNATKTYNMFGVPGIVVRIKNKEHFLWGVDRFPFLNMLLRDKCLSSSPKMRLLSST